MSKNSLVVVSPPGGVGEVAVVKAATTGTQVKWFVVSAPSLSVYGASNDKVTFPKAVSEQIELAGGSVDLAGGVSDSLLQDQDSTRAAISSWCGSNVKSMVCCLDGTASEVRSNYTRFLDDDEEEEEEARIEEERVRWKQAVRLVSREAAQCVAQDGTIVAILSNNLEEDEEINDEKEDDKGGMLGMLETLFGNDEGEKKETLPSTLVDAVGGTDDPRLFKLRHGSIFGLPESSPRFSPLVGGPQKIPEFREEMLMKTVRVDPSRSATSGKLLLDPSYRATCETVGQAATLMALRQVPEARDVFVASLPGNVVFSADLWSEEFQRTAKTLRDSEGVLFTTASNYCVLDAPRLAKWLAEQWFPNAMLSNFELNSIMRGERPSFAVTKVGEGGVAVVRIVWQTLVDSRPVNCASLLIAVTPDGSVVARRGPGDAGFETISKTPLVGEEILVRLLADGTAQAIPKKLARIIATTEEEEEERKTTVPKASVPKKPRTTKTESGPRQAGARRSTPRSRGTRRTGGNEEKE